MSFALMGNGALLAIKDLHGAVGLAGLIPSVFAVTVAMFTYLVALQRQRTLRQHPLPTRISPHRQVYIIGIAVLLLIVVTAVTQLI
jgi:hypothetical protein